MFTASTESSADVKTSMNQDADNDKVYNLHWTEGDKVLVSDGSVAAEFVATPSADPTVANLSTTEQNVPLEGAEKYYAVFPAVDGASAGPDGYTVVIPSTQTWEKGEFDMPMVGVGGSDMNISFMNAASILKITPNNLCDSYDKVRVAKIEVTSASADIAGNVAVSYDGESLPQFSTVSAGSKTITLDCGAEGAEFSETFFIALVPGSYESLTIKITSNGGGSQTFTLNTPAGKSYERSKYASVGVTIGNLAIYETANCYLVKKPGTYKFPVNVKGNGNAVVIQNVHDSSGNKYNDAKKTEVTVMNPSIDISTITDVSSSVISQKDRSADSFVLAETVDNIRYADGYVTFTVPENFVAGNVRIGVHASEDIYLWSWHIWVNEEVADVSLGNVHTNIGEVHLMNMNLGSLQTSENLASYAGVNSGLYYQWGRKDPFPPINGTDQARPDGYSVSETATEEVASQNPTTFYTNSEWCSNVARNHWGAVPHLTNPSTTTNNVVKTMFDPCPPGYHVLSAFIVKTISYDEGNATATFAKRVKMEYFSNYMQTIKGDKPVFPFDGYRSNSSTSPAGLAYKGTQPNYWTASYYNNTSQKGNIMRKKDVTLEGETRNIAANTGLDKAYACSVRAQKQ